MMLSEYQVLAHETAVYPEGVALLYTSLGLAGEAGELANQVKKVIRDDAGELTDERRQRIVSELGDCLWYVAEVASAVGVPLDEIARRNVAKLRERAAAQTINGDGENR